MSGLFSLLKRDGSSPARFDRRLWLWVILGAVGAIVAITAAFYFDVFTESSAFCGQLCHPNRPEYVTHQVSAHAHVECGTCHVGPGLAPKVTAKIFGVQELVALATNSYGRPIEPPVERLRPAREICEQCHWPDKFYGDRVIEVNRFAADEGNSATLTYLVLRTGGGNVHPKDAPGIHWHIDNPVYYVATDPERQDIPWVGSMDSAGQLVEYVSVTSAASLDELRALPRREMDCLDCHNRATHEFRKPEDSVDEALGTGGLDRSLPYIKREAARLLSGTYATQEAGLKAMEELATYYQAQYATVYVAKRASIDQAVAALKDIYRRSVFPEMNLTWKDYADNIGHSNFAGCFRCHDGKHLTAQGDSIRLDCSICHSIPVVTKPDQQADLAHIVNFITAAKQQPSSHEATNFVRDHRFQANDSCAPCHGSIKFGSDNSGFCANEACHGRKWPQADLDAAFPHPVKLEGKHAQALCNECHKGVQKPPRDNCVACHKPPSEPHFSPQCSTCHNPTGWGESAKITMAASSPIPHRVVAGSDCLQCHANGRTKPAPATHKELRTDTCLRCHRSGPIAKSPVIPHAIEWRGDCLLCHGAGKLRPTPAGHKAYTSEACVLCHELGAKR